MTKDDIDHMTISSQCNDHEVEETHISWVVVCPQYAYKIKKPVRFSFLDFSTLSRRKHYCERELILNRRLTRDVYLNVVPVKKDGRHFFIGEGKGDTVDYAVQMRKLDSGRRMDLLIERNLVSKQDIEKLAERIARFHQDARIVSKGETLDLRKEFNALLEVNEFLGKQLRPLVGVEDIYKAIAVSDSFLEAHASLFADRSPFYRDCHGDLHCQNIFLTPGPVIFDCIEFNDQLRYTDVLNEIAFLCMDLEAYHKQVLAGYFVEVYNGMFPVIRSAEEWQLFNFYKSYRANIRAKVFILKAEKISGGEREEALKNAQKYLDLMNSYLAILKKEMTSF